MVDFNPPLLGNGYGLYKIHIIGNSGTGKSTLGAYLSGRLSIPYISLDEIVWKPGWQKIPVDEFREKVRALMAQNNTRGWIVDGNYRAVGTLVADNATDIIWLDPPLYRYFPRLFWRTLMRIFGLHEPCAEGCVENWGEIFSSNGIVRQCVRDHAILRTRYTEWLARINVEAGRRMIRLDESRGELARWKAGFERHLRRDWFG